MIGLVHKVKHNVLATLLHDSDLPCTGQMSTDPNEGETESIESIGVKKDSADSNRSSPRLRAPQLLAKDNASSGHFT